jgi:MoaA/NifB/PqqE/SkfB family radical SAM enzyme
VDLKYSITSNEAKLFKHLDRLALIQSGKPAPTQLHLSPTNKCNLRCSYCCFDDRDRSLELDLSTIQTALTAFKNLGLKSCEITGGGEPTLYTSINELIEFAHDLDLSLGMNSNALEVRRIARPNRFSWIRVVANIFDLDNPTFIARWKDNVLWLQDMGCTVTACYIVTEAFGLSRLDAVAHFADKLQIPTRIAPDCILPPERVKQLLTRIEGFVRDSATQYCFNSAFNVYFGPRTEDVCMMHMLKPYLYTDGWVYACPSSELAPENGKTMNPRFRICRAEDITEYYTTKFEINHFPCSYCKYTAQNEILRSLTVETNFNAFV